MWNRVHRQSHVDSLKNEYSVSLFLRNNSLAKIYFSWNPNFLLLHISFFYPINQHRYNHDRFSKILRSFCGSRNYLEKQLANILDGVSCFSVTLFHSTLFFCGGKANLVRFILFYSTLLTLTHGRNDWQRNKYTRLEEPFLQLCCCVSFLFWRGIGFVFTYLCT